MPTFYEYDIHIQLYNSCQYGNLQKVKELLTTYPNYDIHHFNEIYCRTACIYGRLEIVKYLLSEELPIESLDNIPIDMEHVANYAFSFLCHKGYLDMIDYLLSLSVNIRATINKDDGYGFQQACKTGHLQVVKYLCKKFDEYSFEIINDKIIPKISYKIRIDNLKTIDVKDTDDIKCLVCCDRIDIINLNCHRDKLHCYCLSCYEEIYKKYKKCSYCMQPININNIQKINMLSN